MSTVGKPRKTLPPVNDTPVVEEYEPTVGEERANAISHGVALLGALIGSPILIATVMQRGDSAAVIGACVFSVTMVLLYFASTVYHALPKGKAKRVFQALDHGAIFLLIAGTYTPFTLGVLRGPWGWLLFSLVWALACLGIAFKIIDDNGGYHKLLTYVYLAMGWLAVIAIRPIWLHMPQSGFFWLLAGGLSYTVGVVFFSADRRLHYNHLVWHLFVMGGTTCHYFAVLWYAT